MESSRFFHVCRHVSGWGLVVNLKSIPFEIKEPIQKDPSKEMIYRAMYDYDDFVESISAWKAHLLGCVNQDQCRTIILQEMVGKSIFLNLDWAMR